MKYQELEPTGFTQRFSLSFSDREVKDNKENPNYKFKNISQGAKKHDLLKIIKEQQIMMQPRHALVKWEYKNSTH